MNTPDKIYCSFGEKDGVQVIHAYDRPANEYPGALVEYVLPFPESDQ
jgi:hypothetical protein